MNIWILQENVSVGVGYGDWKVIGVFGSYTEMLESIGLPSVVHPIVWKLQEFRDWFYLDLHHPKSEPENLSYCGPGRQLKYQCKPLGKLQGKKIDLGNFA